MGTEYVEVGSEAELRELLGEPMPRAVTKERTLLHERDREWLAASPFCLIATSGPDGTCDVSPKGDPPGFAPRCRCRAGAEPPGLLIILRISSSSRTEHRGSTSGSARRSTRSIR